MLDTSVTLPTFTLTEQILTNVLIIVCAVLATQWLMTSFITKAIRKSAFLFFLTAIFFGIGALVPRYDPDQIAINDTMMMVNSFLIIFSDFCIISGMTLVRVGKLIIYNIPPKIKSHAIFALSFLITDLMLVFTHVQSIAYFILAYSVAMILISFEMITDCLSPEIESNATYKFLDAVPFGALIFLMTSRLMTIFSGISSEPAKINEEYIMWGYLILLGMLNINLSVHVIQRQFKMITAASRLDSLTHVYLRNAIIQKLTNEYHRADRYDGLFSIIFLDIDYFKKINDRYGHASGDDVLKHVSKLLVDNVRKIDTVGRWGGEEFIIILPKTDLKQTEIVAEKLRSIIASTPVKIKDEDVMITASFGISDTREEDFNQQFNIDLIIDRADQAMYEAKQAGRNKVVLAK